MGLLVSLASLSLVGGVLFVLPTSHIVTVEERLRRPLAAAVSGLIGYVLLGVGFIPVEQVPLVARALRTWLPYEAIPALVSLVFAGVGLLLAGYHSRIREWVSQIIPDQGSR